MSTADPPATENFSQRVAGRAAGLERAARPVARLSVSRPLSSPRRTGPLGLPPAPSLEHVDGPRSPPHVASSVLHQAHADRSNDRLGRPSCRRDDPVPCLRAGHPGLEVCDSLPYCLLLWAGLSLLPCAPTGTQVACSRRSKGITCGLRGQTAASGRPSAHLTSSQRRPPRILQALTSPLLCPVNEDCIIYSTGCWVPHSSRKL